MLSAASIPQQHALVEPSTLTQSTIELGVKRAMIKNPYLDDMIQTIRNKTIPWEEYESVGLLTEDEVVMIKHVENISTQDLAPIMTEHGLYYAALYLELTEKLARVDALQKVLVLVHDMLEENEDRIALFHQAAATKDAGFPFGPFHKALRINDEFIGIQSSKVLTLLVCSTPNRNVDINEFFRWMTFQLQSPQQHVIDLNIQILDALFHIPDYRKAFWTTSHAIDSLVNILKKSNTRNYDPQKVYEVTFAIWLLTFDREIAKDLDKKCRVIVTLVQLAKSSVKEKVIRIIMATFKNLIEKAPSENMSAMLVAKLLPLCEHFSTRKWTDVEIGEDVKFVQTELQQNFQSLTTFEVYASELETGMLEWSPSHESETFWRENASRLNDDHQKMLRQLARLLSSSENPIVLAVACHDIGQYVKHNPKTGRRYLDILGAKQRVMELMTHEDPEVKYHALSATQKYFSMTL